MNSADCYSEYLIVASNNDFSLNMNVAIINVKSTMTLLAAYNK
jgi:hypothetical protein